jgi:hypothetical protein
MSNFQNGNQDQILKKLNGDFSAFQQGKEGQKLVYPVDLRKKVTAAIEAGITPKAAASACKISVASIRSWSKTGTRPLVKRLKLDDQAGNRAPDLAIIYINDHIRIQLPASQLNAKLLKEIIDARF